jgi:hypothetical protein
LRPVATGDARPSSLASGMPIWRFNTPQHQLLTRTVVDWLLLDGHHIAAVEGKGFAKMMKIAEPRFEPPSRSYIQHVCQCLSGCRV